MILIVAAIGFSGPLPAASEEDHTGHDHAGHDATPASPVTALSPGTRELLVLEMKSIQESMVAMLPLMVSGDWQGVSQYAARIANGHIMKQRLTPAQVQELMRTLPQEFKALDSRFHNAAGMMAHVAREGHTELVTFYYYRLIEGCIGCHSQYATHRFPALIEEPGGHSHAPKKKPAHNAHH